MTGIEAEIVERCVQANLSDRPDVQLDDEDLELLRHDIRVTLEAAAPHMTDARWTALRDYLSENIAADEAVRQGMVADGEDALAGPFGGLVSAIRSTLAKMREMEAGQ